MCRALAKTCEYCGRGDFLLEESWCSALHRWAQEVYEQGEFVVDLFSGRCLKRLRNSKKHREFFPKARTISLKSHDRRSAVSTGKKCSKDTREKMSKNNAMKNSVFVERMRKTKIGIKHSKITRDKMSEKIKEGWRTTRRVNGTDKLSKETRKKLEVSQIQRVIDGTHNLLRDDRGARNFYYERLFDDVFTQESFVFDVLRTTKTTLRVFDGWDSEDLSELYREKFVFECDFFNDELNVDFEIDEEHHFDQIDYDYERDIHFLKDRATLTFRYRLFDILSREQEVREDMKFVIFELRKGNRDVKSKFEYTKEECRKKWDEYFRQKVLKREFVEGNRDVSNV